MKSHFCMPTRMRPSRKTTRLSPMSLLDRFREAVFRLIMISALSRPSSTATATTSSTYDNQSPLRSSSRSSSRSSPAAPNRNHRRPYYQYASDLHHSEAVADCIEFIKRSANEGNRDGGRRSSPVYDITEKRVVPLPVM